jgi:hypothetical protein
MTELNVRERGSSPEAIETEPRKLLNSVLEFVEGNARWWLDAAANCERFSSRLSLEEKAEEDFICAVYRERAKAHLELVARTRLGLGS